MKNPLSIWFPSQNPNYWNPLNSQKSPCFSGLPSFFCSSYPRTCYEELVSVITTLTLLDSTLIFPIFLADMCECLWVCACMKIFFQIANSTHSHTQQTFAFVLDSSSVPSVSTNCRCSCVLVD